MVRRQSSAHAVLLYRSRQRLRTHPVRAGVVRSGGCSVRGARAVGDRTRRRARADHHEPVAVRVLLHGWDRGGSVVRQRVAHRVAAGRGVGSSRSWQWRSPRWASGSWFDLDIGTVAGAFAGAGTATAALGAVQQQLSVDGAIPPRAGDRVRRRLSDHGVPHDPGVLVPDVGRPAKAHSRGPREGLTVRRADARTRRRPEPDRSWTVRALRGGRISPDPRRVDRRRARRGGAVLG